MGRRKNNPELVEKLIEDRWTLDHDRWEERYETLSKSDKSKVGDAILGMEKELEDMYPCENDWEDL